MTGEQSVEPQFDESKSTLTIPDLEGVDYKINGSVVTGEVPVKGRVLVRRSAKPGFKLEKGAETEFKYEVKRPEPKSDDGSQATKVSEPATETPGNTAGNTPENQAQQAAKTDASNRNTGTNPRLS